jgi:uncharacterized membrane protein YeaQ/YmgE (transglycosylase-associated protein family)
MLLIWILTGGIAGWLASLLLGEDSGCATNIIVGMVGSLIGGAIEVLLRTGEFDITLAFTDFNLTSIIVSTLGAIVLLGILSLFRNKS